MNILSISKLLPVPGIITQNDFVLKTYDSYLQNFPEDQVEIIKPIPYTNRLLSLINRKNDSYYDLKKLGTPKIRGFKTHLLKYLSARTKPDIHAKLTQSLYHLNKNSIKNILKDFKPDVSHAQLIFPDGYLALQLKKKFGIPYLITTHNELDYFKYSYSGKLAHEILSHASKILPLNYKNLKHHRESGHTNTELMPLGFDQTFLATSHKPSMNGSTNILTVAELIKLKNIDQVIRSVKALSENHPVKYTIIGEGPEKERLQKLTKQLNIENKVVFKGFVAHDKIAEEMAQHDVFIMPSYIETFGRVYFEAMAIGLPVICARGSGIYGYYNEEEEGITVDHTSVNDISTKLKKLITDKQKRHFIGQSGKNLVMNYTWDGIAKILNEHYRQSL